MNYIQFSLRIYELILKDFSSYTDLTLVCSFQAFNSRKGKGSPVTGPVRPRGFQ